MKWWPSACQPGDMIRVQIGAIYHYGIFADETEIVQFGLPPVQLRSDSEQRVCVTDMEGFSGGKIVEVGCPDRRERKQRFSAEKTLALARARIGEGGYNLIHNNCEHFVYECVFGIKRCTQEEEARRRWNSRPILDVYFAAVPEALPEQPLEPPEREREVRQTANLPLASQKYAAWKTLEYAVRRSFGYRFSDLRFTKERGGKWSCDKLQFSIAHTDGAVAVAVSNGAVGVDLENVEVFSAKYGRDDAVNAMCEKALTTAESAADGGCGVTRFLRLWTKKESIYKYRPTGSFQPQCIETQTASAQSVTLTLHGTLICSVCGDRAETVRFFRTDETGAHRIMPQSLDGK